MGNILNKVTNAQLVIKLIDTNPIELLINKLTSLNTIV